MSGSERLPDRWPKTDEELSRAAGLMPAIDEGAGHQVGEDSADLGERVEADSELNLPLGDEDEVR